MEMDDIIAACTNQVINLIPDIDEAFLLEQVKRAVEYQLQSSASASMIAEEIGSRAVEALINRLFEEPNTVVRRGGNGAQDSQRTEPSGSQKRSDVEDGETQGRNKRVKRDWMQVGPKRGSPSKAYVALCLHHIRQSFPTVPTTYLTQILKIKRGFYAPTHFHLFDAIQKLHAGNDDTTSLPFKLPTHRAAQDKGPQERRAGKGKSRSTNFDIEGDDELVSPPLQYDEDFEEERLWVIEEHVRREAEMAAQRRVCVEDDGDKSKPESNVDDKEEEVVERFECGCCFDEFSLNEMVECPEGHIFCTGCITQLASTSIVTPMGPAAKSRLTSLVVCPAIGASPCYLPFSASVLKRALPDTLYQKWERECQRREVDAAEVDEMEECPFCDWRCIMTVSFEEEKLFRCENDDAGCGVISCRKCKKPDHLPQSCEELLENFKPDKRRLVEEAMSQALVRNCPKCKKAFVKELGCNKMTCPYCGTFSCYVCRQEIQGYRHFDTTKCNVNDGGMDRNDVEVERARRAAIQELKGNGDNF